MFPKSVTRSRIEENFAIFDFELSDVDVADITGLNRDERTGPNPDTFDYVPLPDAVDPAAHRSYGG